MDVQERETVVVKDEDRSSVGWLIPLLVVVLLLLALWYFGAFNALTGSNNETEDTTIDTPETIQLEQTTPEPTGTDQPAGTEPTTE